MAYTESFDVVVIGAGPGGRAADTAALLGKTVAVVEKHPVVGGAAVNTGTIPSKTLRETALALSGLAARALYGVDLSLRREATVDDLLRHERAVKAAERRPDAATCLDRYGVTVVRGTGSVRRPAHGPGRRPRRGGRTLLRADKVVVAIGSAPVRPPLFPFEHPASTTRTSCSTCTQCRGRWRSSGPG